ncbi:MAG: hypothetical protein OCD76_06355 [Reichenbachiella sp.]
MVIELIYINQDFTNGWDADYRTTFDRNLNHPIDDGWRYINDYGDGTNGYDLQINSYGDAYNIISY